MDADVLVATATSLGGVTVGWLLSQFSGARNERRLVVMRRAQQELEAVRTVAELVGALLPHVSLTPIHRGQLIAALDMLPEERLPLTLAWADGDPDQRAYAFGDAAESRSHDEREQLRRMRVRNELRKELRRLLQLSAKGAR